MKHAMFAMLAVIGILALAPLTGCAHKKAVIAPAPEQVEKIVERVKEKIVLKVIKPSELSMVHFAYRSSKLSLIAREILQTNAAILKENRDWKIIVEGHCDSRGSSAYNYALGAKRADALTDYYISLGISPERVTSVSYGEDVPWCEEKTAECYAMNRRGITKVE